MPRDNESIDQGDDDAGPSSSSHKAPLKRGDACLYCRKRRIRCSAEKPTCQHCRKLRRECVYDVGKPVSRVKQLEDKVAQLEGMLKATGEGEDAIGPSAPPNVGDYLANTPSLGGSSSSTPFPAAQGMVPDLNAYNTNFSNPFGIDFDGLPAGNVPEHRDSGSSMNVDPTTVFPTLGGFTYQPAPILPQQSISGVSQQAVSGFDFSTLDPGFMDLVSSFGATSTTPASQQLPFMQPTQSVAPVSTGLTPFLSNNDVDPSANPASGPSTAPSSEPSIHPGQVPYQAYVSDPSQSRGSHGELRVEGVDDEYEARETTVGDDALLGGWFDAADIPKVARDHLLDLFFSRMKVFGQEFHIPRFFASLALPPNKRPHQCLLYSMYLLAAKTSSSPSIRGLEPHFAKIALSQLEESIAHNDRLFDGVRAMTLLAVYYYGSAHYFEGWMMTGRAANLAVACGLHAISSSVWKPAAPKNENTADLVALMRQRMWMLPPPRDPIELGERIWAFWTIYATDRSGAISYAWPVAMPDDIITTPYPKPLYEYELGLVSTEDDRSISELYDPSPKSPMPHYSDSTIFALRMRAMSILDRSSKLMYLPPERNWERWLQESSISPNSQHSITPPAGINPSDGHWAEDFVTPDQYFAIYGTQPAGTPSGGATKGWMRTARVRTPRAYDEVRLALERLELDLPQEFRTNWYAWDGKPPDWHNLKRPRDFISQHFIIGCAWMFLFDVFSFNTANDRAVQVARRIVTSIVKVTSDPYGSTEVDIFSVMTWSFVSKVLIREVKRLQAMGNAAASAPLEAEIESIVQAQQVAGKKYKIGQSQAFRTDRYRTSTTEDTQFMEEDEVRDEIQHPIDRNRP